MTKDRNAINQKLEKKAVNQKKGSQPEPENKRKKERKGHAKPLQCFHACCISKVPPVVGIAVQRANADARVPLVECGQRHPDLKRLGVAHKDTDGC